MEIITEKKYSILDLDESEKQVLVSTIRHRYVTMPQDDPDYNLLNKILCGLK